MSKVIEKNGTRMVLITNARASYPHIFRKNEFEGNVTKFEITALIEKADTKTKALLDQEVQNCINRKRETSPKYTPSYICVRDGDVQLDNDGDIKEGHEGCWSLKASSDDRPWVLDRAKNPITESDGVIYGGCYVNVLMGFWAQDNKWGKKINANLYGVQFVEDGEPLGSGKPKFDPEEVFDDLEMDTSDL